MIRVSTTMEHSRCDSCGGPGENADVAEIVTMRIGREGGFSDQTLRLCHPCIENELLPAAAPWAVR